MGIEERYLESIDRTLKLILAELQKSNAKPESKKKKRPVTKEEVLQQSIKGKPPDKKRKAYK